MPINFSNVRISIGQFQAVASGDHNAGEVKLTSETSIDRVNHHVSWRSLNKVSLSHEEVLAIKNAFIKALSDSGINVAELNRVREELGLAPMKPVDVNLHERSIKPLSRQQVREILDRNAAAINDHLGAGTIRTSDEIYARVAARTRATRRNERDVANAELSTRRNTVENRQINLLQSVLAGDVDFYDSNMRKELLKMAKSCLDTVLASCNGRPTDGPTTDIVMGSASGKRVVLSSGLSEKALVRKLEDIIVRLSIPKLPSGNELAIRNEFKALATPEARVAWAANLMNDPQGAFKARVAAVMIMHDRGIDDFETLSVVNHLKDNDAIAFLANLVSGGMDLEGDALRQSAPVQTAFASVDAAFAADKEAYIPALSNQQFNARIASNIAYAPDELPVTYQLLVNATKDMVRARYGVHGYSDKANPTWLTTGTNMANLTGAEDPTAPRITPETLRAGYTAAALNASARRVLEAGVLARLATIEPKVSNPINVVNALKDREPAILAGILAAQSAEEAEAVLDDYTELLAACARRAAACERCQALLDTQARELMASKLGVPVQSLPSDTFSTHNLTRKGIDLKDAIGDGTNGADTDAEIEAAYKSLVDQYVNERMEIFAKIDSLDIAPEAKDAFKADVLKMDKVNYLDINAIADAAKKISSETLAKLLTDKASAADILGAMREINLKTTQAANQMFDAAIQAGKEIGPDEMANIIIPMMDIIVLSRPGLEPLLSTFLASEAVTGQGQDIYEEDNPAHPAVNFMTFAPRPDENANLAAKIGSDKLSALHVQALMAAVRDEGLGEMSADEARAFFKPGQPAGDMLKLFVETATSPVKPSTLHLLARTALRNCKAAIDAARQNKQKVDMIANAFTTGQGAASALAAGYHASELPKIAQTFAFYKVATNATDEVALAAALDPASKASRLMSYGGRFTESVENFRAGLKLIDDFEAWFAQMHANAEAGNFTTKTERFLATTIVVGASARALEGFLFAEIAVNGNISLNAENPEDVFGMENNPAMRFVGRGYTTSFAYSLAQIPSEKRGLIYAVFDALDPLPEDGAVRRQKVGQSGLLAARIMKNFDAVAKLRDKGNLDRRHIVPLLYGDLGVAPTATNKQIEEAFDHLIMSDADLAGPAIMLSIDSGASVQEVLNALRQNQRLPNAPGISNFNGHLESLDGTAKEGRATLVGDLIRPTLPSFIASDAPAFPAANCKFTVHFPDNTTLDSSTDKSGKKDTRSAAKDIADKIETLCGKVHQKQLNSVYFALSQSSIGVKINGGFRAQGIESNEHMALTFTLEKNEETGDVKIRYSEPEGFPLHFSWEVTVHLDGSTETTPMVVDVPQDLGYKALAGAAGTGPFTSSTVVSGNGPGATLMRNLIDTRCGVPENASPNEKANAFMSKVNAFAAKDMVYTVATVASKNLVVEANGQKREDFEAVNFQFNRDFSTAYKLFFPGVNGHTNDYNTNRDRLVKFLTDDKNATFANATTEVKRQIGVLMALLTQYTGSVVHESVSGAMALPGSPTSFNAVGPFGADNPPVEFSLSKDANGNIKINSTASLAVQMIMTTDDDPNVAMVQPGSQYRYSIDITLPKDNLETLAKADWTQYNRQAVTDYDGDLDGRIALIPEQFRFTGTVNIAYHMHLNEA